MRNLLPRFWSVPSREGRGLAAGWGPFMLVRSPPRTVSPGAGWALFHDCWMYGPTDWWRLPGEVWKGWKNDRNLVG